MPVMLHSSKQVMALFLVLKIWWISVIKIMMMVLFFNLSFSSKISLFNKNSNVFIICKVNIDIFHFAFCFIFSFLFFLLSLMILISSGEYNQSFPKLCEPSCNELNGKCNYNTGTCACNSVPGITQSSICDCTIFF